MHCRHDANQGRLPDFWFHLDVVCMPALRAKCVLQKQGGDDADLWPAPLLKSTTPFWLDAKVPALPKSGGAGAFLYLPTEYISQKNVPGLII
jgi:hypothetical protein